MEAIERILRANGDPYVILDLPMDSSDPEALKAAKRQGVLLIHPDKNSHPQAADAFRMLIEAFDRLHSLMRINPSSSSDEMTEVGSATEELTPQERQAYNLPPSTRITPAVSNEILMAAGTWTLERHGSVAQA
ncbi:unnamed protein product [Tilletia controversa]|nr:unnamed protein product [Tilletia controversa]